MKTKPILFFICLLLLSSLACNFGNSVTNQQAQAAVATASVVGQQAQQLAATAAVQGQNALATVQASDFQFSDLQDLQSRVATILPDENGNVNIIINDSQLTEVVQTQQTLVTPPPDAPKVQNLTVQFTGGNIVLRGDVTEPIQAQLTASFLPLVENGSLRFVVVSASIGSINVPAALLQTAESSLNDTLGEALTHLPAGVTLQAVTVGEGTLTITAHQG